MNLLRKYRVHLRRRPLARFAMAMLLLVMVTQVAWIVTYPDLTSSDKVTSSSITVVRRFNGTESEEAALFTEDHRHMFRSVHHWLTSISRSCDQLHPLGGAFYTDLNLTDGVKRVCFDPPLMAHHRLLPCLVYSFGVNRDWSFDATVNRLGCDVVAFDPFVEEPAGMAAAGIDFHNIAVSSYNSPSWSSDAVQVMTLDAIVDWLQHSNRTLSYLKMDVEGEEVSVLWQQLLNSSWGRLVLDRVEQIGLEVHLPADIQLPEVRWRYRVLQMAARCLHQLGFRLVWSEVNPFEAGSAYLYPGLDAPLHAAYEILLVKSAADVWDRSQRSKIKLPFN